MSNNTITNKSLLILQSDDYGLKSHVNEFQTILFNKRIYMALITKILITKYSKIHVTGYNILKTNHQDNNPW